MSILIDENTTVLIQGITGSEGTFHSQRMLEYGTKIVAGVTPGKGGTMWRHNGQRIPVYNTVADCVTQHEVDATAVFVPGRFAGDAVLEAVEARIELIVCITEHIPVHEMLRVNAVVKSQGRRLIGPNCPGLISPGKSKLGILPNHIFAPGPVGIVSRSGTLTYEIASQLTKAGLGQSTVIGIGGDPIVGTSFIDVLADFERDEQTKLIVLVGEIGGSAEERAADFIASRMSKPVIAYIAGFSAPPGRRMGHAGAIISGSEGTAAAKEQALTAKGVRVARTPRQIVELAQQVLAKRPKG